MFLKNKTSGDMVEVLDMPALIDPCQETISGRYHSGEEMQDNAMFEKGDLIFPSGETLPQCWTDKNYRV
jgi:hypothetical protein